METQLYSSSDAPVGAMNEPTYVRIKRAIIRDLFASVLRPGTHITIDMLTSRYKVSHMPVREALRQLEGEGVIFSHAHKGFRIAEISDAYIRNIYDIRIGIESLLARRAVENGNEEGLTALEAIHGMFLKSLDSPDRLEATRINIQFHNRLYLMADNLEALQMLEGRTLVVRTFGSALSGYREADRPLVAAEHQAIVDAIRARDAVASGQAVFDHVTAARERLVERLFEEKIVVPSS